MGKGKNFNLFLMDGEVTGRIKCTLTLSNWTGLAYKIPNSYLSKCKERQDLKQSGVYFLFGDDEGDKPTVYIGQAGIRKNGEGVLFRVAEHLKGDFDFNEVVILTTQNNSFGPTEISYLENKFTNMALETDRYKVRNGNDPNPGNVTEEKESELEDYVEYSKIILGVLGYKIFVPLIKSNNDDEYNEEELSLYLTRKVKRSNSIITAKCKRTSEGFVLLSGSKIEETDAEAIPPRIKAMREAAKKNSVIKDGVLTKNILFGSASYASAFALGMTNNGRTNWKLENGQTLKAFEEEQL